MAKDIKTNSEKIDKLINRIADGDIKIPPLQRSFVWKIDQIIKLLESIYLDYPIGSILLWETNDDLPASRSVAGFKIPEKKPDYPHNYVLDGQQRLSALYGVFCSNRKTITQPHGYKINHEDFDILFDLKNDIFIHSKDKDNDGKYLEAKYLLDSIKFIKALSSNSYTTKDQQKLRELHSTFLNYEIPIVTTKKRDIQEVGIIFERINNTGTPLGLFDLMVAWTWTGGFHLQEKFDDLFESLDKKNFSNIKHKIILQSLSGILKESSASKVILSLDPKSIRDNFELLRTSLEKAVDYLSTELSVKTIQLLPHMHQIVPLCYVFSLIDTPSTEQKKVINEWFWKTSFSRRYSSSTDTHIDEDIENFKRLVGDNNTSVFKKLSHDVSAEQLRDTKFSKTNSFSRAFIVLLSTKNPKNLVNGTNVDMGEALSSFNSKEYHHVFPKSFLEKKAVDRSRINSLCNFCVLPADSNRLISDKAPSDYFENIVPKEHLKEILATNLLPSNQKIYQNDSYDLFLEERSRSIIDYLNNLLI